MSDLPKCKPPCPGPHAHTTRHGTRSCNAHIRANPDKPERTPGTACLNPPTPGATVCPMHGSRSGHVRRKAAERVAKVEAERTIAEVLAAAYGDNVPAADPGQVLLDLVKWKHAEVIALRGYVADLDERERVWGRTRSKEGGDDRGDTYEAKPNIWWQMLREAERDDAAYSTAALKAGLEERKVRLAEDQGRQVSLVLRAIFARLSLTPEQEALIPVVVPEELRRLTPGEAS